MAETNLIAQALALDPVWAENPELPACAHETTSEAFLAGSILIRCTLCRYRRAIAHRRGN
jgi:hypothetical protein